MNSKSRDLSDDIQNVQIRPSDQKMWPSEGCPNGPHSKHTWAPPQVCPCPKLHLGAHTGAPKSPVLLRMHFGVYLGMSHSTLRCSDSVQTQKQPETEPHTHQALMLDMGATIYTPNSWDPLGRHHRCAQVQRSPSPPWSAKTFQKFMQTAAIIPLAHLKPLFKDLLTSFTKRLLKNLRKEIIKKKKKGSHHQRELWIQRRRGNRRGGFHVFNQSYGTSRKLHSRNLINTSLYRYSQISLLLLHFITIHAQKYAQDHSYIVDLH